MWRRIGVFLYFTHIHLLFMSFFQKGFEVTKKVFKVDSEYLQKSELGHMMNIIRSPS